MGVNTTVLETEIRPVSGAVRSHCKHPTRDSKTMKLRPLECERIAKGSDFSCQHCKKVINMHIVHGTLYHWLIHGQHLESKLQGQFLSYFRR